MAISPNVIFIGIFFYPLVDLFFSYFEIYCQRSKKRYEDGYSWKMCCVIMGWTLSIVAGFMIVACWNLYWNFVDINTLLRFGANEEDESNSVAYLIIFFVPVVVYIVYETDISDDLTALARSSPMEFSILFTSGPILLTSGAFKILSPLFFGLDWIFYFVCFLVYVFYLIFVGATAADQDYERDDDERDELELDEIGTGVYSIEGLDGMVIDIKGDKYMFVGPSSWSRRMIRLDQLPRWILDDLTEEIAFHTVTELVGKTFKWFYYFSSPSPYSPRFFSPDAEASLIRVIEEDPELEEEIKYLPLDHPLVVAVEYERQIAERHYDGDQALKKYGVFHWLKKLWRRRFLQG